jgi:hypothetical protein
MKQRELRELLWNWGPIGAHGAPDDEYDWLFRVLGHLQRGIDEKTGSTVRLRPCPIEEEKPVGGSRRRVLVGTYAPGVGSKPRTQRVSDAIGARFTESYRNAKGPKA